MQFVVLRNPSSSKNRAGKTKPYPSNIKPIDLTGIAALPALLTGLHRDGVKCIIVDGGDGTVREILSYLPDIYGSDLPFIGILPNGNTNLIARNTGALHSPASLLKIEDLPAHEDASFMQKVPMLRLDFEGSERASLRGFMMGWGAFARATQFAIEENTSTGPLQVLDVFFKTLKSAFLQGRKGVMRQGIPLDLTLDGEPMEQGNRFIGLVTTLKGPLVAGLNPFWGKGEGSIRWTDVLAPAPYLVPASLIAATGRCMNWMLKRGYHSGSAEKLDLIIDTPLVLDGELISIDQKQKITISAQENVYFISI
ncbi:MAG: diacylglycerol kinase family protein [Hyphomicrobiales bacterium]